VDRGGIGDATEQTGGMADRARARRAVANTELLDMLYAFELTRAICAAAELGIADLLVDGPRTVEQLADVTGTRPELLYRLLRALASRGIFEQSEHDGRQFALTELAESLLREGPGGTVHDYALYVGKPFLQRSWEQLVPTLRTGQPAFDLAHGLPLFEYLASEPSAAQSFNDAMTSHSRRDAEAVIDVYDFADAGTIVDVAGGHGTLIAKILVAAPGAGGVLFDLPQVVSGARETLRTAGVADRCLLVEGDMFESVPVGGDIYTLKRALHDWSDEQAIAILRNCRAAMSEGGRVLVIEIVIDPGPGGHLAKFYDLMMMVVASGRERTEAEYAELFDAAGLRLARMIRTPGPLSVIEAVGAY
jgi:O-methyltransferase/methyltransferase family protein